MNTEVQVKLPSGRYATMEAQDVLDQYGPQVLLAEADRLMDHAKSEWDNPDLSSGEYLAGLRSAEAEAERLRALARSEG